MSSEMPGARTLLAALRGNEGAIGSVVGYGLPRLRGRVEQAYAEIEHRRENEWDEAAAREEAMNGDVTMAQTAGALSDIHRSLIRFLAWTGATLMADEDEMMAHNEAWERAMYQLLLTIHNPSIKYGIIGGLDPEIRPEAEDYFERYSREIWGTLFVLTSQEEITWGDFPPETGSVGEAVGRSQQAGDE